MDCAVILAREQTYTCCRDARVSNEKATVWVARDAHKGRGHDGAMMLLFCDQEAGRKARMGGGGKLYPEVVVVAGMRQKLMGG